MSDTETFLKEAFESNFERLRIETGRALDAASKQAAWEQVLLYWRKLQELAENVTDTEVKLTLPEQATPSGRRFTLEGVVDIVQDQNQTTMYDIKTHLDNNAVQSNLEPYFKQLNVYAHIWQNLRNKHLHQVAIIATRPTRELRMALDNAHLNPAGLQQAMNRWQPVIPIDLQQSSVDAVITEFGEIVDCIEEHRFQAPTLEQLLSKANPNDRTPFGTTTCRNCDARFSCNSYRQFAKRNKPQTPADRVFFEELESYGSTEERERFLDGNLATLGHGLSNE